MTDIDTFRAEVRDFLHRELPADVRADVAAGRALDRARQTAWQRALWRRGWVAPGWPTELGGCDWSARQRHVFDEECVRADAPFVNPFGLFRAGPVIIAFGTPAQKGRFLPGILDSSTWWCQGYSEPGAGSDLAAVSLAARRNGDHYVLNGTKTWTTQAHLADWMFLLARTSRTSQASDPRQGISFLLVGMKSPGITVRPITLMNHQAHVNEVHFSDVAVPVDQRVGDEGQGWQCSGVVLGHERLQIAEVPQSRRLLARAIALARELTGPDGSPLARSAPWRERLAALCARLDAHALVHQRQLLASESGPIGAEVSMLKLRGAELRQAIDTLVMDMLGTQALHDGAHQALVHEFLYSRASTIYGGSNEIQRNILARRLLGF